MSCRKKRVAMTTLLALAFSVSGSVQAQTPAEQVKSINEEIAVLSAKLSRLEIQAKIAAKEAEAQRAAGISTPGFASQPTDEMPVVRAIDGMDGKLVATLAMRGGVVQTVREGEKFGAWTTKAITVNSVTLSRGKEVVKVPFGNEPPAPSGNNGGSTHGVPAGIPAPNFPR